MTNSQQQLLRREIINEYPDSLECSLKLGGDSLMGLVIQFSKNGQYIAVGCNDGRIIIYDFATRAISVQLKSNLPSKGIMSLQWFNNGKYLLASYIEMNVSIWDITRGIVIHSFSYPVWTSCVKGYGILFEV
jgi:COMPASS component SWD1